jgi:hypothetical protein
VYLSSGTPGQVYLIVCVLIRYQVDLTDGLFQSYLSGLPECEWLVFYFVCHISNQTITLVSYFVNQIIFPCRWFHYQFGVSKVKLLEKKTGFYGKQ